MENIKLKLLQKNNILKFEKKRNKKHCGKRSFKTFSFDANCGSDLFVIKYYPKDVNNEFQ